MVADRPDQIADVLARLSGGGVAFAGGEFLVQRFGGVVHPKPRDDVLHGLGWVLIVIGVLVIIDALARRHARHYIKAVVTDAEPSATESGTESGTMEHMRWTNADGSSGESTRQTYTRHLAQAGPGIGGGTDARPEGQAPAPGVTGPTEEGEA